MAQIKKLQPGGTAPKSTYGRLIQNGKAIEATDDMLNWLDAQGYYGQQMASAMRSGDDQYIDTDEQGVGWIKNIAIENPELKEKQQTRSTQAARRLEGRRLREARNDIQRLATYDYGKFTSAPKNKEVYPWKELVIDYNTDKNGKRTYSDAESNLKINQRISDIEGGLIIPEGQEFERAEELRGHYNAIGKEKFAQAVANMKSGNLTENDLDILETFGITTQDRVDSKKASVGTSSDTQKIVSKKIADFFTTRNFDKDAAEALSIYFNIDSNGKVVGNKSFTDKFGQNYWFNGADVGFEALKDYALVNGRLLHTTHNGFKNWLNSETGKSFVEAYNLGDWTSASKYMGFSGSSEGWDVYNPETHYSSYLSPYAKYRDITGYYNTDGYLGVYDVLSDPNKLGLNTVKRIAIKSDGTIEDASNWQRVTANPMPYNTSAIHSLELFDENVKGIPLTQDKSYWLVVDQNGNKQVYKKNWRGKFVTENLGDLSKLSVNAIKQIVENKVTGRMARYQPGGAFVPKTQITEKTVEPISNPRNPYSIKDISNGVAPNIADIADLTSLALDLGGLVSGEVPGLGEGLGIASDVAAFVGDVGRDGFQWGDAGNLVTNLGLTAVGLVPVIGTGTGVAKVMKKLKKAEPVVRALFIGAGLAQGVTVLDDVLNGDINVDNLRMLANGIMAVRGIYKNRKGKDLMEKYGELVDTPKTKAKTKAEVDDLLEGLSKKDRDEIVKKTVDAVVEANPGLKYLDAEKTKPAADWFDGENITDYEKAWEALRGHGHIADAVVKENSPKLRAVSNQVGKAKGAVEEGAKAGLNWFKSQVMPVDASQYRMKSNITEDEIAELIKEGPWIGPNYDSVLKWVRSNKKGGKIKKCDLGVKFETKQDLKLPWMTSIQTPKPFTQSEAVSQSKGPLDKVLETQRQEFSENIRKAHHPEAYAAAQKDLAEIHDRYNARIGGGDITYDVAGGGDKNSKLSPDYVGLAGGIVEGLITGIANDKVLDKEKEAIRKQSIGAMKSMPTMQPLLKYNLNPLITQYDKQKADLWSRTVEIGNATSDQRLRLAGNLATSSQIAKGEDSLLSTISKHITDVDLQNVKLRHQYAEDERQVADYNRQLGGNTAAALLRADAQGIKKQSDNLVKQLAEARTDYNQYQNVASKAKNWDQYMDLYKKWADLPNGAEKEEAYQNLQIFKAMMESGGIRNPYTGVSAADMVSRKMKK